MGHMSRYDFDNSWERKADERRAREEAAMKKAIEDRAQAYIAAIRETINSTDDNLVSSSRPDVIREESSISSSTELGAGLLVLAQKAVEQGNVNRLKITLATPVRSSINQQQRRYYRQSWNWLALYHEWILLKKSQRLIQGYAARMLFDLLFSSNIPAESFLKTAVLQCRSRSGYDDMKAAYDKFKQKWDRNNIVGYLDGLSKETGLLSFLNQFLDALNKHASYGVDECLFSKKERDNLMALLNTQLPEQFSIQERMKNLFLDLYPNGQYPIINTSELSQRGQSILRTCKNTDYNLAQIMASIHHDIQIVRNRLNLFKKDVHPPKVTDAIAEDFIKKIKDSEPSFFNGDEKEAKKAAKTFVEKIGEVSLQRVMEEPESLWVIGAQHLKTTLDKYKTIQDSAEKAPYFSIIKILLRYVKPGTPLFLSEEFPSLDWPLCIAFLEYKIAHTPFEEAVREALLKYCRDSEQQLTGIFSFFTDRTIKAKRLIVVNQIIQKLYQTAPNELKEALKNTLRENHDKLFNAHGQGRNRGVFNRSQLCDSLEQIIEEDDRYAREVFSPNILLLNELSEQNHRETELQFLGTSLVQSFSPQHPLLGCVEHNSKKRVPTEEEEKESEREEESETLHM